MMLRLAFLILLVSLSSSSYADKGCLKGSTTKVYSQYAGYDKLGYRIYEPTPEIEGLSTYCYWNTEVSCAIRYVLSSDCPGCYHETGTGDDYYYATGQEWVYYPTTACPIDDYVPHIVIAISCVGVYYLRNRYQIA